MDERWKQETRKWAEAWSLHNPKRPWNADQLIAKMEARLPAETLLKVSKAFDEKLIETDPDRGHFIRVGEKQSISTLGSPENDTPFWELFVQLAEFRSLHVALAQRQDVTVSLEDGRMDLAIRNGGKLVAYVEAKEKAADATKLARHMLEISGKTLDSPDGDNASRRDAYRKAWYLLNEFRDNRREPGTVHFSVRSGGKHDAALHEQRFLAHVDATARTVTLEEGPPGSVVEWADVTFATDETRRALATLAWRVVRSAKEPMFVDLGRKEGHRVYRVVDGVPRLALEFQRHGAVLGHRETGGLSTAQIDRLRDILAENNLDLADRHLDGRDKQYFVWQDGETGRGWIPTLARAQALAPAVAEALATST